ncbi:hypothetical protein E1301_Tti023135 [Triplophysa tibetana]|uniref:Ig-like domain-containing protein n=1 Tax=Triplophysa tibetana TaxID=1572043 RepID=A0A5A9NXM4_9TELE|nr:hypothetical protein E1301_Tti023135 [Triplophysa tibetana]
MSSVGDLEAFFCILRLECEQPRFTVPIFMPSLRTSAKHCGYCLTICLASVRRYDFNGFNSASLISSTIVLTISLRSLAAGRFPSAMAVLIPVGILFQGTSKFSGHAVKSTIVLDRSLLDILGVMEELHAVVQFADNSDEEPGPVTLPSSSHEPNTPEWAAVETLFMVFALCHCEVDVSSQEKAAIDRHASTEKHKSTDEPQNITQQERMLFLMFLNLSMDDAGLYRCKGQNSMSHHINVTVTAYDTPPVRAGSQRDRPSDERISVNMTESKVFQTNVRSTEE